MLRRYLRADSRTRAQPPPSVPSGSNSQALDSDFTAYRPSGTNWSSASIGQGAEARGRDGRSRPPACDSESRCHDGEAGQNDGQTLQSDGQRLWSHRGHLSSGPKGVARGVSGGSRGRAWADGTGVGAVRRPGGVWLTNGYSARLMVAGCGREGIMAGAARTASSIRGGSGIRGGWGIRGGSGRSTMAGALAAALVALAAPVLSGVATGPADAATGPAGAVSTISSCTTAALDAAVAAGGAWTFTCSGTIALDHTFGLGSGSSLSLDATGHSVTLSGTAVGQLFNLHGGVLSLTGLTLTDATLRGAPGTTGASGAPGANGSAGGPGGVGIAGRPGGDGTAAMGGAVSNNGGTVHVATCTFTNDAALGGAGGNGGSGGAGGNGGDSVTTGGSGGVGGVGGAAASGGSGGNGAGGAIFNTGTLTVTGSTFSNDSTAGGPGGASGMGGDGGNGGGRGATGADGGQGGSGAPSGAGGSAEGGAIANTGSASVAGSTFSNDVAAGGRGNGGSTATLEPGQQQGGMHIEGDGGIGGGNATTSDGDGGNAGSGGAASPGESASGGAIFDSGNLTLGTTGFSGDAAFGGSGGPGGWGGVGGPGGGTVGLLPSGGDGGNGGNGTSGADGGNARGGALFSATTPGPGISFSSDAVGGGPGGIVLTNTCWGPPEGSQQWPINGGGGFFGPGEGGAGGAQGTSVGTGGTCGANGVGGANGTATGPDSATPPAKPTVTKVAPPDGPLTGGTTVTISGSNFTDQGTPAVTSVTFVPRGSGAPVAATSFHVVSDTTLTAVTPNVTSSLPKGASALTTDVQVSTSNGSSAVDPSADQFVFGVHVASITPNAAPPRGGTAADHHRHRLRPCR